MHYSDFGIDSLIGGVHENPAAVLGPHEVEADGRRALAVRAFLPDARQAWLVNPRHHSQRQPMQRIHPAGLYEAIRPLHEDTPRRGYCFRIENAQGETDIMHDSYAFDPLFTEFDLFLLGEGRHYELYHKLGAQVRQIDDVTGVNFAVWAPNAAAVSVVGDFNSWDARKHMMRKHIPSGVWEVFVPKLAPGEKYKYQIKTRDGALLEKTDPLAFAAELPPRTASVVADLSSHRWNDARWMQRRAEQSPMDQPLSIYEVHLGSWRRDAKAKHGWMNYRDLAHELVDYCKQTGFTHLELLPIAEHPFTGSWGYQIVSYFAATSRYGTPEDFMYFVDYCHQHDIGVILDWVPAHFPRDGHGLMRFDGTPLYEHADPRQGEHPDWGTLIFNYGRHEVRNFLTANALFWLDKYHVDGLRVDAVASMLYLDYSREQGEWIPNRYGGRENLEAIEMVKEFNEQCHEKFPGVLTIAEESTSWGGVSRPTYTGGLGFSMKWNMGWMNDTLAFMRHNPIHRRHHHNELTFSLIYAFTENFIMPLSHDEVVHGKGALLDQMPGDLWQRFANLRLLYSYMWSHPGKKLLFMGSEFGQWEEWNYEAGLQWSLLEWETHQGVQTLVSDLNALYRREPALHELDFDGLGFEWIDCHSSDMSVLSYIRKAKNPADHLLVCCNFTPVPRENYRLGAPTGAYYQEIFNSDSQYYGGSNVGNYPGVQADKLTHHGRPYSVKLTLPPLSTIVLKPR